MSSSDSEHFESADEDYEKSPSKDQSNDVDKKENKSPIAETSSNIVKNVELNNENQIEKDSNNSNTKEDKNKDEANDDGWDFDEWEEDIPTETDKNKNTAKEKEISQSKNVGNIDEDKWDDFECDWNDGSNQDCKETEKNTSAIFPALKDISSEGDENKHKYALDNLSKLVGKEPKSSFQAFPILNDLSEKKKPIYPSSPESQEIVKNTTEQSQNSSNWGWKPWGGVVSLLSTATEGVTSLTSHVSQGLSSVLESGIGVPEPEEMARINAEKEKNSNIHKDEEKSVHEDTLLPSLGNIVTGVTTIGNKVITGGLDTLEGIGKKTMTILQENDPLLLNKRKFLGLETEKPNLSQVLREAKEKSEEIEKNLKQMQKQSYKKQLHFESLFDNYYGLVHLEALEMLSKQAAIKLQSLLQPLTGKALAELQETLNEVKELCELGDLENDESDGMYTHEELSKRLSTAVEDLGVDVNFTDIVNCWKKNVEWLENEEKQEASDIYENGLRCLSETCALAICRYHKIAEILLIIDHHSTANEADSLVQLTTIFCSHLNGIATRFGGKLYTFEQTEDIGSMITSIFLEVYNSTSYVQSAFQLFIPILQIGAA